MTADHAERYRGLRRVFTDGCRLGGGQLLDFEQEGLQKLICTSGESACALVGAFKPSNVLRAKRKAAVSHLVPTIAQKSGRHAPGGVQRGRLPCEVHA